MKTRTMIIWFVVLLITSCWNALSPDVDNRNQSGQLHLAISTDTPGVVQPKTIFPVFPLCVEYEIFFSDGPVSKDPIVVDNTSPSIILEVGTWMITVAGRDSVGGDIVALGSKLIEIGSGITSDTISIAPTQNGSGWVELTIDWPDGVIGLQSEDTVLATFNIVGEPDQAITFIPPMASEATHTGSYPSGDYRLLAALRYPLDTVLANVSELVRVYDNTTTTHTIVLTDDDFRGIPAAPTGLEALAAGGPGEPRRIELSWIDNAITEDGFTVERKEGAGGTFEQIAALGANAASYTDTGLNDLTEYFYRVRAYNVYGETVWAEDSETSRGWLTETVASDGAVGRYSSIALDSNGLPHISCSYNSTNVLYAFFDGNSWGASILTCPRGGGEYTSIVLDSYDDVHISFFNGTGEDHLEHAYYHDSAWEFFVIDESSTTIGWYSSISFAPLNTLGVAYKDVANANVKYAWFNGGWNVESPLETDGTAIVGTTLAYDGNGHPHLSYTVSPPESPSGLKHVWDNGSTWQYEVVDSAATGAQPTIAIDDNNYAHIAYRDDLEHLSYAAYDGSDWNLEVVDDTVSIGYWVSLSIDMSNYPHICYHDYDNTAVKYARWDGTEWHSEIVDNTGHVGAFGVSLKVDSNDVPHMSYDYNDSGDLKYAVWVVE